MGTPSITHSGSPSPVIVLVPLIRIFCVLPGCPDMADTATPAILPCMRASTVGWAWSFNWSAEIIPTEPVIFLKVVWV